MSAQFESQEVHTPATQSECLESTLEKAIHEAWQTVAPFWPLQNIIATNPLAGFEDLPFQQGLAQGCAYFQQKELPEPLQKVNQASLKWLALYFDQGQASITLPQKDKGLLQSVLALLPFDDSIPTQQSLPTAGSSLDFIDILLQRLDIQPKDQTQFLTLLLTTLPGWAAHVQYQVNWADGDAQLSQDYLALRLLFTSLFWPQAKNLLETHQQALAKAAVSTQDTFQLISARETAYQNNLLPKLEIAETKGEPNTTAPKAQLVFCIDVRSEPFRKVLEAQGDYETFGFAGFFGLPLSVHNTVTKKTHASCPVLLKPAHEVRNHPSCATKASKQHQKIVQLKKLYQSTKHSFTTAFPLVETLGLPKGFAMGLYTFAPTLATKIKSKLKHKYAANELTPDINSIPLVDQINLGFNALTGIGLTKNFAPLVVFCGHGSETTNNAFASSLDCGACGGQHGGPNAKALAAILNNKSVRVALAEKGISIPETTAFLAAQHNTTTDKVSLFIGSTSHTSTDTTSTDTTSPEFTQLTTALKRAQQENAQNRCTAMGLSPSKLGALNHTQALSADWAQTRPEWGLARNAAFIIAPRWLTKNINLEGRSFLHGYNWEDDSDGTLLTGILTAPMIVTQWINSQYLFSTLDNTAYGAGSKVTQNIVGTIGVMQGNGSDLMHGLPLQSVNTTDTKAFHQAQRLSVIVRAPKARLLEVIENAPSVYKLVNNQWVLMICHDPETGKQFRIGSELEFEEIKPQ